MRELIPVRKPKLRFLGREWSSDEINTLIGVFGVSVFLMALVGLEMIAVSCMILACVVILIWGVSLIEEPKTGEQKFAELRRVTRLRRDSESESESESDGTKFRDVPAWVYLCLGCLLTGLCVKQLHDASFQHAAANYPSVIGTMTRYEMVDVDLGSQLEVEYEYTVNGQRYHGDAKRFVWRQFRVGTANAKKLALNWGPGKLIPVFYEPDNPANSALDNTFCKGDELFVGLNALVLLVVTIVAGFAIYSRWLQPVWKRRRSVKFEEGTERIVVPLSNLPLYGTLALTLTGASLGILIAALVGGFFAMSDGSIPWLVSTIDWLYVITFGSFIASLVCSVVERISYGRKGRTCVIDMTRKQLVIDPQGFGETERIRLDDIESIKVVSNRDDFYRLRRTFSPTIFFKSSQGSSTRIVLQRDTNRTQAVRLVSVVRDAVFVADSAM